MLILPALQRREILRIGVNQKNFDKALVNTFPSFTQMDFCKKFDISYHYLSNLKSKKIKERACHSAGPSFRKKLLTIFEGKYSFDHLFYEVK